jgi:hypothetical protein
MLNQSYNYANTLGLQDPSMKYEVQKFLLVTKDVHDIHEIFLTKCPSGILNGLQAKRLRTGPPPSSWIPLCVCSWVIITGPRSVSASQWVT